ncbi:MAG: hypothetical protein ABIQ99_17070 [Thermoflexales bacterium]
MQDGERLEPFNLIRLDAASGEFNPDKDWSAFDACETCRGASAIDETPEGDLICATCRATLPRPEV